MIELKKETSQKKGGVNMIKKKSILYIVLTLIILVQMSVGIIASDEVAIDEPEIITEPSTALETEVGIVIDEPELQPTAAAGCDQYGSTEWPDVTSAQTYYGNNWTYTTLSTPIINGGKIYTHYYTFTDGSRMYFGVKNY